MFSRKNPQTDVNSVGINSFNISAGCVWNFPTELSGKYSSLLNVIAWISLVVFREIKEKGKKCHKCQQNKNLNGHWQFLTMQVYEC